MNNVTTALSKLARNANLFTRCKMQNVFFEFVKQQQAILDSNRNHLIVIYKVKSVVYTILIHMQSVGCAYSQICHHWKDLLPSFLTFLHLLDTQRERRNCQNMKMSESIFRQIRKMLKSENVSGKCQNHSKPENVRITQNW